MPRTAKRLDGVGTISRRIRQEIPGNSCDRPTATRTIGIVRSIIANVILLAVLVLSGLAVAATNDPTTSAYQMGADSSLAIRSQIARLGDADPAVRGRAADALVQIGAAARPAVLAASHGDDPQVADAAQQVLRALPWSLPDDPPEVKKLLDSYGQSNAALRIGIIAQLAGSPQSQPALLRLLSEELNEDICWQIESQLISQPDAKTFAAARQFDPNTSRPAALLLGARAWLTPLPDGRNSPSFDRAKALAMLKRAVDLEVVAPTYDNGQLDFAFDQLAARAVEDQEYDRAATLRRQQCDRIGVTRTSFPSPFFELLALHSDFGPLAGFDADLQNYPAYVSAPESLFCLSRLYARLGQTLTSQTLEQAARAASSSEESRAVATNFLADHGWIDLASRECRATLSRGNASPDNYDVNARLRLSSLAAVRGDEAQAADQLRIALDERKSTDGDLSIVGGARTLRGVEAEHVMRIELAQHALHAAQAKGDTAEAGRQVDELLRLGSNDEEAALDLVPELKLRGRGPEAAKIFQSVYAPLMAKIDGGDADASLLNETAWLCSRCGEHLDEALDYSNRAVAIDPNNSAYLDTNADAHFRKGLAAEAAQLETKALKIQPGDPFMQGQLKRFQAGTKGK